MSNILGFNGERADPISGHYHLGNGYRAYSPVLMRFTCPDSWSPFGAGGINPYAYCEGDPINRADPSGHMSGSAIAGIVTGAIGIVLGIVSLLSAPVTGGSSIAAWMSTMATVTGLVSDALGIAGAALEERNPAAAKKLGWASLALGVVAMGTGLAAGRMAKPRAKKPAVMPINTDGYASEQVDAWDRVATRGLRHGGLPGGAPTGNSRVIAVEASTYKTVSDNFTQLNAIGLFQCTAVGIEYNNYRTLVHFYQSNLRYGIKEAESVTNMANKSGASFMTEFVEHLYKLKDERGLRNIKVKVMSGLYASVPPSEFMIGNESMMHLLNIAGAKRFKIYRGSALMMLERGGFEVGNAEKIKLNMIPAN